MRAIERFLWDRGPEDVRGWAFAIASATFGAAVFFLDGLPDIATLLLSWLSLQVAFWAYQRIVFSLRSKVLTAHSWAYHSSDFWGLAQFKLSGSELRYDVRLFESLEQLIEAWRRGGKGGMQRKARTVFTDFRERAVEIAYEVEATDDAPAKRGFLVIGDEDELGSGELTGRWASAFDGRSGWMTFVRLDDPTQAPDETRFRFGDLKTGASGT